ncbi:MAG: MTH938/NDUFAF3 family protein [Candidatus Paceibacterota bacterium]
MIDHYEFGKIVIDGEIYDYDVEVRWNGKVLKWWRDEGHVFAISDIKRAVEEEPEAIVLGTGANGRAEVSKEARNFIQERKIKLIIDKTKPAIKSFELLAEEGNEKAPEKVIGLFHLTC